MKKVLLAAATAALVAGGALSPAGAESTYYLLSVDILGADGGVTLHKQVKCRLHDDCRESFPVVIEGKPQTLFVMSRVPDEHHIYVTARPGITPDTTYIASDVATKPFEAGSEWTMQLTKAFTVPIPPEKRKFKWITTEQEIRPVLKFHMKLES
jgi:hypothetical protein